MPRPVPTTNCNRSSAKLRFNTAAIASFNGRAPKLPPNDNTSGRSSTPSARRAASRSGAEKPCLSGLPVTTAFAPVGRYCRADSVGNITALAVRESSLVVTPG